MVVCAVPPTPTMLSVTSFKHQSIKWCIVLYVQTNLAAPKAKPYHPTMASKVSCKL